MEGHDWTTRILAELRRRRARPQPPLVVLRDLAVLMLGDRDSHAGLAWFEAIQQLQDEGWIRVDHAGYVVLTDRETPPARPSPDSTVGNRQERESREDVATRGQGADGEMGHRPPGHSGAHNVTSSLGGSSS